MKTKVTEKGACARSLRIDISPEVVAGKFSEVYEQIRKVAKLPGFRPGKAPLDMIKTHYQQEAREQVIKDVISESYVSAIEEQRLVPVTVPQVKDVAMKDDQSVSFTAEFDIRPRLALKKYKGLVLKRPPAAVSDGDVSAYLDVLRDVHAQYEQVSARPLAQGDYIVCDLRCSVDGVEIENKKKLWLYVDEKHLTPGLALQLIGMTAGEERTVEITLPKEHPHTDYAGKQAVFTARIHEIKQKKLPDLTDDFARNATGVATLAELRTMVAQDLSRRKEQQARKGLEQQVIAALLKEHGPFDLPPTLVERQAVRLREEAVNRMKSSGADPRTLEEELKKSAAQITRQAEDQVRIYFLMHDIADTEKLAVSEEDVSQALAAIAASARKDPAQIKREYEDEDRLFDLREHLKERKTMDFLIAAATVQESDAPASAKTDQAST